MWSDNTRRARALTLVLAALTYGGTASAEIELTKTKDWTVTTDGRVNGFVSYLFGDQRPDGLDSLLWVGFNESGNSGQADADGKLSRTRVRSGYVPSTLAFNFRKHGNAEFKLTARTEIGFQITNIEPSRNGSDLTWMDPRSVYLDMAGSWGSVRAGRDLSLFPRGNLIMNYELGHAYGVGFPCAYEYVFGGACGHVGFGTLWPDFRAQITYSTPKFGDVFQVSAGVFDPRTVPTYSFTQLPMPRFEGEAVADYRWAEGWGIKAWTNGAYQQVGIGVDTTDPVTFQVTGREDTKLDAYGVGGGLQGYLGPVKLGASGYTGKGMDGFSFLTFNPIIVGQRATDAMGAPVPNEDRRFRPTLGYLVEASFTIGSTWIMGGYGKASFDRIPSDVPLDTVDGLPLLRSQTGISAGVFHRIDSVVLGLDYFRAHYGFDPQLASQDDGSPAQYVDIEQTVNIINGGVKLEW
jgi:hypothetical protein